MKKAVKLSLGFKFSAFIMCMGLLIGALIIVISSQLYSQQITDRYSNQGMTLIETAAPMVDWDRIDHYAQTLETDPEYDTTLERLRLCANSSSAKFLYVMVPYGDDCMFIYDTDSTEGHLPLGYISSWEDLFGKEGKNLLPNPSTEPTIVKGASNDLLFVCVPFYDSKGNFVAYMGVDYTFEYLAQEEWGFIGQLIIVTLIVAFIMTLIVLALLRLLVIKPIRRIANAANNYLSDGMNETADTNTITDLHITTHDELQDLTESLKSMESKIRAYVVHLEEVTLRAETDGMTGLLNGEAFERRVERALLEKRFSDFLVFMMIDLDHFKDINDSFGHQVGDDVLIKVAHTIKSKFRETDYVARVGGDEFAVFFDCPASLREVENRVSALCNTIRNLEFDEGVQITVSIGTVVVADPSDTSYQKLFITADRVLYKVKERGRNGYLIHEGFGGDEDE